MKQLNSVQSTDVQDIYSGINIDYQPEIPYLWIIEDKIIPYDDDTNYDEDYFNLQVIICAVCYDSEDLEQSYKESKQLAIKAGNALEKQFRKDSSSFFEQIDFSYFSGEGVIIEGADNNVHQSAIAFDCIFNKINIFDVESFEKIINRDNVKWENES